MILMCRASPLATSFGEYHAPAVARSIDLEVLSRRRICASSLLPRSGRISTVLYGMPRLALALIMKYLIFGNLSIQYMACFYRKLRYGKKMRRSYLSDEILLSRFRSARKSYTLPFSTAAETGSWSGKGMLSQRRRWPWRPPFSAHHGMFIP